MEGALKKYCTGLHKRTFALILVNPMLFNEVHPIMYSNLEKIMQPISLSPASLQVPQFQLHGLQAAGAQRAAEQLQEKRAGHHPCQLEQQPPSPCGTHTGRDGQNCTSEFAAVLW